MDESANAWHSPPAWLRVLKDVTDRVRIKTVALKNRFIWPPVGFVPFWAFYRTTPLTEFGFSRGTVIDRLYITEFLKTNANDICGRVLEFGDRQFTLQFGSNVSTSDVIDLTGVDSNANIIADITDAPQILDNTYDCIVCTQVLGFIFDLDAAVKTLHRILKSGGVLLLTVPGRSTRIGRYDSKVYEVCWSFTAMSVRKLLEKYFPRDAIKVAHRGNMYAAIRFQVGFAAEDCNKKKLAENDECFQVLIAARAVKNAVVCISIAPQLLFSFSSQLSSLYALEAALLTF